MTDQELRDLLHERVADVSMPDLSDTAWGRARRIRRRRTAGVAAGGVAAVVVLATVVAGMPGADRSPGPGPATQQSAPNPSVSPWPERAGGTKPDGQYGGWPVYWGPLVPQEETLPRAASPFPDEVDLSVPAPDVANEPISSALAAYALIDESGGLRLRLLAPDGSLRSVDTSRVAAYDDGAGHDVSVAHDTLLSPTGEYLGFIQRRGVLVLTLATGKWRTVHIDDAPTTAMRWMGNTDLWLPPTTQGGEGPMYSVVDGRRSGATNFAAPAAPFGTGSGPYGRWRMGPRGTAQSWGRVEGLPVPRNDSTPSQVVFVQGDVPAHDALLVLGAASMSQDDPRPDHCCGVVFWLDDKTVVYESQTQPRRLVAWRVGTHDFGLVTSIEGFDPDQESLVSSYARIWDR